jgi:hypothetical protein
MAHTPEVATLIQRAQRACDDLATVRDQIAITRAEAQRLITIARQASSAADRTIPEATILPHVDEPPTEVDPHALAMEVLRMIRELLNGFPIEWQVTIVKALTARTMLIIAAQSLKPPLTPAA